jgi:hypothetical protein
MKYKNIKDKVLGRIIEMSNGNSQITFEDYRFYKIKDTYYPSVSTILQSYPKGTAMDTWFKKHGTNSDNIAAESAEKGTRVHNAIEEMLIHKKELKWIDENGYIKYSKEEWIMILKFQEFWNKYKPKLIYSELHLHSETHGFAGTIDLIIELNGEIWVLDIKTSNALHTSYELQTSSYVVMFNEHFPDIPVTKCGILWLNSNTRKEPTDPNKIGGRGWSLTTSDRTQEENFQIFLNIKQIFHIENPKIKPVITEYPNSIKLNIED